MKKYTAANMMQDYTIGIAEIDNLLPTLETKLKNTKDANEIDVLRQQIADQEAGREIMAWQLNMLRKYTESFEPHTMDADMKTEDEA